MVIRNNKKAFTLVEAVLAIALAALILVPMTGILTVALKTFEKNTEKDELIQHARNAMFRMSNDLRYAEKLLLAETTSGWGKLEFETRYLVDTDGEIEKVMYEHSPGNEVLYRRSDLDSNGDYAGTNETLAIAGFVTESNVMVDSFEITPLKYVYKVCFADPDVSCYNNNDCLPSGGTCSDYVNEMRPLNFTKGDTLDDAEAVQMDLTMKNKDDNDTFTLSSTVKMRNKR